MEDFVSTPELIVVAPQVIPHITDHIDCIEPTEQPRKRKLVESISSRVIISLLEESHDRLIKVNVQVSDETFTTQINQVCTVMGLTERGTVFLFFKDENDEFRVWMADKTLISSSISTLIKNRTVKSLKSKKSGVPTGFHESDFLECSVLREADGAPQPGYFIVTKVGPLFGKVCDKDMMRRIIDTVTFALIPCNKSYKFFVHSELLKPAAGSVSQFPLGNFAELSGANGIVCASSVEVFQEPLLPGAFLLFGNRQVTFANEKKLNGLRKEINGELETALAVLRQALGCQDEMKAGEFIPCTNQV